MAHTPSFAVIVPAYNAAETLAAALQSLYEQTLIPAEILVVDDGSSDTTGEVARSFGPPVRVLTKENGGTASARNLAMHEATAEVFAFLDADDVYTPDRLERIAAKFVAEPELEAVATDAALEYDDVTKLVSSWWPRAANRALLDATAPIVFCTLALRRELVAAIGDFDARYEILEDLDYWYRIGCRGHLVGYVPDASYRYRVHAGSKTHTRRTRDFHLEFARINFRYALTPKTPARIRARLAVRGLREVRAAIGSPAHRS